MTRPLPIPLAVLVTLLATASWAAPTVVDTEPLSPEEQRAKFRLPAGFEIQLVAAEPEIQKPMNMAFDTRGRLWVTHSVEYPFAAPAGAAPRDGLTVLDDFGPDGRARRATRFADGLNIPIGVLPLPCTDSSGRGQAVIVWSIPHIWKLTDDDGDGRADRREVLYGPFAFDDTHGNQNSFRLAPDGWVYANHGFRNHSRVKLRGEGPDVLELKSGNGYRFRPDGSAIEQVSWGQVNPFGMDFDSLGNRFNADCHSRPLTMLLRGGRYTSVFAPKNDDYDDGLGQAPETTADNHGSTGICAVAICDTPRMPALFQGSVFVGNVVTNVVHRDPLAWRGSSPWVEKPEEFLACDDWWFRPVDLTMGPDGCLYVADFYNCIIGHYEVDLKHPRRDRGRGRLWRVVWKDAGPVPPPPDFSQLSAAELAALLDAPAEAVRQLAFAQLVAQLIAGLGTGEQADSTIVAELQRRPAGEHRRARTVRALALAGRLDPTVIAAAAADESRLVRVHLVKAIEGLPRSDPAQESLLRGRLADPDPFVRRAAAEALVVRPTLAAVPELLAAVRTASSDDRQLIHAIKMAVAAAVRTAKPEAVLAISVATADRDGFLEIVSGLPGRAPATSALSLARQRPAPLPVLERVCRTVARFGDADEVDAATVLGRQACGADIDRGALLIQALWEGRREAAATDAPPGPLVDWSRWLLAEVGRASPERPSEASPERPSEASLRAAVTATKALAARESIDLVLATLRDRSRPIELRRDAAGAGIAIDRDAAVAALLPLLAAGGEPAAARVEFVKQLAGIDLAPVRDAIAAAVSAAPAADQRSLALAALVDRPTAEQVLALVERGKVSARLVQDPQVVRRFRDVGVADVDRRIAVITRGLPSPDDRIRSAIERVSKRAAAGAGSAAAGAAVFTRHCASCHRHGGAGSLVGPQLDGVAQRGPERLLEDILDPNRNVDAAFRTTVATLADGRVVSGLRVADVGADAVFVEASGREIRVPRQDIEETTVAPLSPMPANVADQVGDDGLLDLLAHLRGAKSG